MNPGHPRLASPGHPGARTASEAVMRQAVPTLRDYFFAAKSSPMRTVWQIWRIVSL